MNEKIGWTTRNEIEWLDNIGRSSPSTCRTNQIDLLRNYVEYSCRRICWNDIDKHACVSHAKRLIARLESVA
jgi:hypothetical protein